MSATHSVARFVQQFFSQYLTRLRLRPTSGVVGAAALCL